MSQHKREVVSRGSHTQGVPQALQAHRGPVIITTRPNRKARSRAAIAVQSGRWPRSDRRAATPAVTADRSITHAAGTWKKKILKSRPSPATGGAQKKTSRKETARPAAVAMAATGNQSRWCFGVFGSRLDGSVCQVCCGSVT